MGNVAPWLTAIVAAVALGLSLHTAWRQRVIQEQSYLILGLTLQRIDAHLIASTSLENRSLKAKSLDTVFLLVGPCEETPTQTINAILRLHGHREVADIWEFGVATKG